MEEAAGGPATLGTFHAKTIRKLGNVANYRSTHDLFSHKFELAKLI